MLGSAEEVSLNQRSQSCAHVVVIDNYDSFTHNIVHALELAGAHCQVVMNDAMDGRELLVVARPDGVLISAGPCTPAQGGMSLAVVRELLEAAGKPAPQHTVPLLGICLGHQAIAQATGARLRHAKRPMHGKLSHIRHDGGYLFAGLPNPLRAARYNSLVVEEASLPAELQPCAWDEDGELMALRHRSAPLQGVQFHPESWLSTDAHSLLGTWVANLSTSPCHATLPCAARQARAG